MTHLSYCQACSETVLEMIDLMMLLQMVMG